MIMQWINYFKVSKFLKKASAAGTPQEAFHILNGIFESSYFTGNYRVWKSTWQTFGQIATQAGEPDLANDCFIAADSWNNPKLLYQCGYNLFERGLFSASVPLYERGLKLLPNDENMLLELVSSLEELGKFNLAKEQLLKVPRILEVSFVPRYLMAYYSIILLDIPAAKKWFEGLDKLMSENGEEYESYKLMHDRIKNILNRIEVLSAFTPLDKHDIRGWNAALNANILLNLSEFGEEMNGRYAFLQ